MMSNYFVIRWPLRMNNTYSFGSTINYENGKIYFKNERMSPGERIHTWKSKLNYNILDSEFSQLPLLKRGVRYQVITKAKMVPEDSVQVQLDFFDNRDEIIDGPLTIDLDGEFEVPEEMDHYQLSLINLNNKSIEFEDLVIQPVESNFVVDTIENSIKTTCIWNQRDDFFEDVELYLRNRLVYSGAYLGKKETLRIFVEFDSRANWQEKQLQEEVSKAFEAFKKVIKKNKMAFDALSPNTILLSPQDKWLTILEKYTTMELSKILHFYRR
ncbi:accessory Sec system protein Asp3 [Pediococcus acidilactici]|uniref:accessory Sec system protein Asp3 n=1 Tax=Pediococcus acidilactici TaxID=1254 RepID=UPI0021690895|nr:accessory Sec system protein Asp3 [Pediococcus acidilactici]